MTFDTKTNLLSFVDPKLWPFKSWRYPKNAKISKAHNTAPRAPRAKKFCISKFHPRGYLHAKNDQNRWDKGVKLLTSALECPKYYVNTTKYVNHNAKSQCVWCCTRYRIELHAWLYANDRENDNFIQFRAAATVAAAVAAAAAASTRLFDDSSQQTDSVRVSECLSLYACLTVRKKMIQVHACTTSKLIELESCSWSGLVRFWICWKWPIGTF